MVAREDKMCYYQTKQTKLGSKNHFPCLDTLYRIFHRLTIPVFAFLLALFAFLALFTRPFFK